MAKGTFHTNAVGENIGIVADKLTEQSKKKAKQIGVSIAEVKSTYKIRACLNDCGLGNVRGVGDTYEDALLNIQEQTGLKFTDPEVVAKYQLKITAEQEFTYDLPKAKKKAKTSGPVDDFDPKYDTLNNMF